MGENLLANYGEAVAMLSHPNIVQVYDVSSMDNRRT